MARENSHMVDTTKRYFKVNIMTTTHFSHPVQPPVYKPQVDRTKLYNVSYALCWSYNKSMPHKRCHLKLSAKHELQ